MDAPFPEAVRELAAQLNRLHSAGRKAVARSIGDELEDHGPDLPLVVIPTDQRFSRAIVAQRAESTVTSYVALDIAEASRPSVRDLGSAFGRYSAPPRVHPDSEEQIVFRDPIASTVTLIATVTTVGENIKDAIARTITLRYAGD